ncbi:MAG: DUF4258 domain-containing protein [Proteobacteria bacterium]|nr:DUF4258 domain-containing protein [Pseudomonadota bacterium]MBU1965180.1 DUF4258 domain-containing protein [Pseudomonadota bacterium]
MEDLSSESALILIHEILANRSSGSLSFTNHAKKQMGARGYTTQDVVYILETGKIMEIRLETNGQWHCKVDGYDLDGDRGVVITAIINENHLLVITVLGGT